MSRDQDVLNKLERPTALGDIIKFLKRLITDGGSDTDIEILTMLARSFDDTSNVSCIF